MSYLRRKANVISGFKMDYSIDPFRDNGLQPDEHPGFFFPKFNSIKNVFCKKDKSDDNYDKFNKLMSGHQIFIYMEYEINDNK